MNSNLDDLGIFLPVFPSRTKMKLHNSSVTTKIVKKVLTNLDSSKVFGPDCIPAMVQFLVPHFSYYALITFLMMSSVILLDMLMILLSTLNVIQHLNCGNN